MPTREFLFDDGRSCKFWEITARGRDVEVAWGRVGTAGQRKKKTLGSPVEATEHARRLVADKSKKGYVETPHARLLRVRPDTRAAARALVFVETAGGPVLVLPSDLARDWNGAHDERGRYVFEQAPCDYDRACARGIGVTALPVGKETALVVGSIGPVAWHPLADGGLLLLWIASDTTAALLEAALRVVPQKHRPLRRRLVVGPSGEVILLDAARRGRSPGKRRPTLGSQSDYRYAETRTFPLAPGAYTVHAAGLVTGTFADADQPSAVSAEVVRLRRA